VRRHLRRSRRSGTSRRRTPTRSRIFTASRTVRSQRPVSRARVTCDGQHRPQGSACVQSATATARGVGGTPIAPRRASRARRSARGCIAVGVEGPTTARERTTLDTRPRVRVGSSTGSPTKARESLPGARAFGLSKVTLRPRRSADQRGSAL
jgi:hypothetical protein